MNTYQLMFDEINNAGLIYAAMQDNIKDAINHLPKKRLLRYGNDLYVKLFAEANKEYFICFQKNEMLVFERSRNDTEPNLSNLDRLDQGIRSQLRQEISELSNLGDQVKNKKTNQHRPEGSSNLLNQLKGVFVRREQDKLVNSRELVSQERTVWLRKSRYLDSTKDSLVRYDNGVPFDPEQEAHK